MSDLSKACDRIEGFCRVLSNQHTEIVLSQRTTTSVVADLRLMVDALTIHPTQQAVINTLHKQVARLTEELDKAISTATLHKS